MKLEIIYRRQTSVMEVPVALLRAVLLLKERHHARGRSIVVAVAVIFPCGLSGKVNVGVEIHFRIVSFRFFYRLLPLLTPPKEVVRAPCKTKPLVKRGLRATPRMGRRYTRCSFGTITAAHY